MNAISLHPVDEDVVAIVVVEGIYATMVLMVILQIPRKVKPHCTTKRGIMSKYNKKMGSTYEMHFPRVTGIITIYEV